MFDLLSFRSGADQKVQDVALIFSSFVVGGLTTFLLFRKNKQGAIYGVLLSIILCAVGWWIIDYVSVALLMFTLAFMAEKSMKDFKVVFQEEGILYPSIFYKKKLPWNEVANCMIKDQVLTIDLKSNKLMQFSINESENKALNEGEFNEYVSKRLSSGS
jgi:hypothetical protein